MPVGGNRQILLRTLYLFPILCNKLISLKQYTSISVSVGLESRHNFSGSYAKRLTSLLTAFKVSSRTVVSSKAYRNLYAGQEATVRTGHGKTDWFQIKGVRQGYILSPCLFNFYAEYIMRNAALEEAQAGIKIAGRNINNLRYADDTTLEAESEEELKTS